MAIVESALLALTLSVPSACTLISYRWVRPDSSGYVVVRVLADSVHVGDWPADPLAATYRILLDQPAFAPPSPTRPYFGQRATVLEMRPGLASGVDGTSRHVGLFHWGSGSRCGTQPDTASARLYLPGSIIVLTITRGSLEPGGEVPALHDVESSVAGRYSPSVLAEQQPRAWWRLGRRSQVLTVSEYLGFYAAMPTFSAWQANPLRSSAALDDWARVHPRLARREPARSLLREMRRVRDVSAR